MNSPAGLAAAVACLFCSTAQAHVNEVAILQAQSQLGATNTWPLDPAITRSEVQRMRDRAYDYCLAEKAGNTRCFDEQDHSLFEYVRSFGLVRIFRSESRPTFPFAVSHKEDPSAFERIRSYCDSIYVDHGSRDVRMLGPCMMVGLGGDFFGIVPVP